MSNRIDATSGNDDTLQNAEQQDADQGYSRDRKLQLAYLPQVSEFSDLDLGL